MLNEPSTTPVAEPICIESIFDLNRRLTSKILPLNDSKVHLADLDDPKVAPVFAALKAIGVDSYFLIYNTLVDKWSETKPGVAVPRQSILQYADLKAQGKVKEMDSLVLVELREMSSNLTRTTILESLLQQAHSLSPCPNLLIHNSMMENLGFDPLKTNHLRTLLSRVKSLFPTPTLYTYNFALYHYIKCQQLQEATEIITEVEEKAMAPPLYRGLDGAVLREAWASQKGDIVAATFARGQQGTHE